MMTTTKLIRLTALAALLAVFPAGAGKASQEAAGPAAALTGIKVSFKLDPRLTRGMYMGDRWVSPPVYTSTVHEGKELTVEARAEGLDAGGRQVKISPTWTPADPDMVTVTLGQGNDVKITVQRAGQSSLEVASPGYSKKLAIKAIYKNNTVQVEISQ